MDSDDAMVAPAASELVGDELDQDHELCLWGDELGKARRRARMQLLKLAMAAWNANVLAEMKAIATANDYGVFYDYGCIDGMNGEYPASESQADWHKETSHENAPPIVTERELLLWGVADQTSCELGQEQSESEQRQRDKCAIEQSMVAAELEAEGYGIFYDYGCIDGMNGEYPAWESQADWHKDTSHENAPPIVIARELLLWGCAKSAGDVPTTWLTKRSTWHCTLPTTWRNHLKCLVAPHGRTSMAIRHPALLPPVAHNLVVAMTSTTTRSCNCGVLCCKAPSCCSKRRTNMHGNG